MTQSLFEKTVRKGLILVTFCVTTSFAQLTQELVEASKDDNVPVSNELKVESAYLKSSLEAEFYYQNGLYVKAFDTYAKLYEQYPESALAEKVFLSGFLAGEYDRLEAKIDSLAFSEEAKEDYHYPLVGLLVFTGNAEKANEMLAEEMGEDYENADLVLRKLYQVLEIEWHSPKVLAFLAELNEKARDSAVRDYYAQVAMLHGKTDIVERLSEEVLAENPKDLYWLSRYTQFLTVYKNVEEAEKVWLAVLADFPNEEEVRLDVARFYLRNDMFEKTLEILKKLPDDDSRLGLKRMIESSALLNLKDKSRFDAFLAKVKVSNGVELVEDKLFLAEVLREHGYYDEAKALLVDIDKTDEDYRRVVEKLALITVQQKAFDEADKYIAEVVKLGADESLHPDVIKAVYLEQGGEYALALKSVDKYLQVFPDDSSVLYQKTLLLDQVGDYKQSIAILRQLYMKNPLDDNSQNALGYMLLSYSDEIDEGMGLVKKAFLARPRSGPITDSVGWGLYRQGKLEEAEFFMRAAYYRLVEPEVLAHLIVVLFERGKVEEATRLVKKNLEALSENPRIDNIWRATAEKYDAI